MWIVWGEAALTICGKYRYDAPTQWARSGWTLCAGTVRERCETGAGSAGDPVPKSLIRCSPVTRPTQRALERDLDLLAFALLVLCDEVVGATVGKEYVVGLTLGERLVLIVTGVQRNGELQ